MARLVENNKINLLIPTENLMEILESVLLLKGIVIRVIYDGKILVNKLEFSGLKNLDDVEDKREFEEVLTLKTRLIDSKDVFDVIIDSGGKDYSEKILFLLKELNTKTFVGKYLISKE